jgi:hypothetical protein
MDDDAVAAVARAAAQRLAPEYGSRLAADVEAALYTRGSSRGPEQYDPVAIAGVIVAIATLAWTIYRDLRKEKPETSSEVAERTLRVELRKYGDDSPDSDKITEVIITEIVRGPIE